jgi:hypothetical protein
MNDEIVEEIQKIREAYAEQFNFDLGAIFEDIKQRELESGREYVTLPPKRLAPTVELPSLSDPEPEHDLPLMPALSKDS